MKDKVIICMGSSCFARGNDKNLELLEKYMQENKLTLDVELRGSCCECKCSEGPNLMINGEVFHNIDRGTLLDILKTKLGNR